MCIGLCPRFPLAVEVKWPISCDHFQASSKTIWFIGIASCMKTSYGNMNSCWDSYLGSLMQSVTRVLDLLWLAYCWKCYRYARICWLPYPRAYTRRVFPARLGWKRGMHAIVIHVLHRVTPDFKMICYQNGGMRAVQNWAYTREDTVYTSNIDWKCSVRVQWNLSGMATFDVKKQWSYQQGVRSRQVLLAWNPMVDRHFHKLENGLSRQGGLFWGVAPDRFHCTTINMMVYYIHWISCC